MQKTSLFYICCIAALVAYGLHGCRRSNGIDNNNVVQTPFSLYFSDTGGALFNTNDGRNFNKFVYPPDGKACRALATCNNNILWAKDHLYYSNNNGKAFNLTYDSLNTVPDLGCSGRAIDLNQSMLVNLPSWDNRIYSMSRSPDSRNWLGLIYSDNSGNPRTWGYDGSYDTFGVGTMPVRTTSVTQLADGTLCGLAYSGNGDLVHHRNFVKKGKDESVYANRWKEVTANPNDYPYIWGGNRSGTPLPPNTISTDTGYFALGHFNNRLIAIDQKCKCGCWYSDDQGANWKVYSGLPSGTSLLCIGAPWEQVCLIGTEGKGLYILNVHTDTWEPNNNGLGSNLTVRNIAAKQNTYKNGVVKKFIYLATDQGIYESADGGRNWTRTIPGNYVAVY